MEEEEREGETCLGTKILKSFQEKEVKGMLAGSWLSVEEEGGGMNCHLTAGAPGAQHRRACTAAFDRCLALAPTGPGNCQLCSAWLPWTTSWEPAAFCTWLWNRQFALSALFSWGNPSREQGEVLAKDFMPQGKSLMRKQSCSCNWEGHLGRKERISILITSKKWFLCLSRRSIFLLVVLWAGTPSLFLPSCCYYINMGRLVHQTHANIVLHKTANFALISIYAIMLISCSCFPGYFSFLMFILLSYDYCCLSSIPLL